MYVGPPFVANAQSSELIQPCEGPLHYPSPLPQPAAMVGVALGKKRDDVSATQTLPDRVRIITAVAEHAVRTLTRPAALSL